MRPTDDTDDVNVTRDDVGNEGGSPGDVEVARDPVPGTGSEAGETWRPAKQDVKTVVRDETGKGRRSP
jgi:hypothetical protein